MTAVDHVFLTRFNLPSEGVESLIRARDGWLRERVELFERYTIPSLARQTCQHFRWIVYLDPQSPAWLLERIDRHAADGAFVPIFRETVSRADLAADLRAVSGGGHDQLLTTNIDNDDGLSVDFVARVQATVADRATAVYLTRGLIKSPRGLFLRRDPANAFCSVREPWTDQPVTCWVDWHNRLGSHMPVHRLTGPPAWLQVVHDNNVSNRVRGRLVSAGAYRSAFGPLVDDALDPTPAMLCREALVARPGRTAREWTRAVGKRAILTVGGKDGLDQVKMWSNRHGSSDHGAAPRPPERLPRPPPRVPRIEETPIPRSAPRCYGRAGPVHRHPGWHRC